MSTLANKIALVTGASKGIGAAIATSLAAAGATVVVNYATSKSGAEKVVSTITAAGGKAVAIQGDFSRPEDITRTFAEIKQQFGTLDILVNNAGIYKFSPLESITPEDFHSQFNLNVLGLILSTQAALPLFPASGGSIVNIGSVVGSMPSANGSVYSATKGAVDNLTIAHSKELGARNIRVNALNPGLTETEGVHTAGFAQGDFADGTVKMTPLGRLGQPSDIAKVAVFLASDDAAWVTGQRILVGGGLTM